jgi:hypothetical protein
MSNHPTAFFHQHQLALAFMQCAARALHDQQIDQEEHTWLETLLSITTGSARVDLLEADDGSDPPTLTGTLMFSDPGSSSRRVFLQSPIYGLEAFEDRSAADEALRHRITRHDSTLEATRVQGDVFVAQMNSYLSKRAKRLAHMAKELARLPALDVQIGDSPTTAGSTTAYNRALHQFWKTSTPGAKHLHQLASKAFAEGFYQDLAQARLADHSNPLLQLNPGWAPLQAPAPQCEKIHVRLGTEWVELAGAFTLSLRAQSAMLLYWPTSGLQSLSGEGALHVYLDALEAPMNLPLKYTRQWRASTSRAYRRQPIHQSVFVDRIDSIVTLQELNLAYTLSLASDDILAAQITVDDAINVCTLIDRRLGTLDPTLRWSRYVDTLESPAPPADPVFKPLLQNINQLKWLATERDAIYRASPGIRAVALRLLSPALAVFGGDHHAETTLLKPAVPARSGSGKLNLVDLLLQRVSGFSSAPISDKDTFTNLDGQRLRSLAPAALEQTLHHAAQVFVSHFAQQLQGSDSLCICLNERWVSVPALLRTNLEDGIRLEMLLHEYFKTTSAPLLHLLKQLLDKPLANQRQPLGGNSTRVSGLQLNPSPHTPGVRLKLALVIDQATSGEQPILFWSPLEGLKPYANLAALGSELITNLTTGPRPGRWQDLLPATQVGVWATWLESSDQSGLSISNWLIEGDPLDEIQAGLFKEQNETARQTLELALSGQDRPGTFGPLIDTLHTYDGIDEYFETQSLAFNDLHTRRVLPDWLNRATQADFEAFTALLRGTLETLSPQNSYLSGIPSINDFAREHLHARLGQDFVSSDIAPDDVLLNLKSFTAAPGPTGEIPSAIPAATLEAEQTLTEAAIDHFSKKLGALMSIRKADGTALPAGLTPDYVRRMIHELDIGSKYLARLNQDLSPENKQFSERRERFSTMASTMLRQSTLQHVLQDNWSRQALAWLDAILEMPDGLARQPVAGQHIIFSRLQLRATPDSPPDTVNGAYVICPALAGQGPLLLFTAYTPQDSMRLYPGRAELLAALHTDTGFQTQLLAHLEPHARRTYDNGGWVEPHLHWNTESSFDISPPTPHPAQLYIEPLTGNALAILFEDTIAHVKAIASTQAVTSAQAQWKNFTDLMTLGVEQASAFLPGRLAVLASLWQAKSWINAATDAARHSNWGKALSEFATALGSLASSRSTVEPKRPAASAIAVQQHAVLETARRLRSFERRDVALTNLAKDLALPIYRTGQTAYAAVEGRVYQIVQHDEHWHIFTGTKHTGPKIRLNTERRWVLDLPTGLYGGGIGSSKIDVLSSISAEVDAQVKATFTVKAKGMQQIRAADIIKARQITAARTLALHYLRTSLINLDGRTKTGSIPHTSEVIIKAAFDLPVAPSSLARRLRNMIADIYVDMLSTSMSPKTSQRYIVGSHKRSENTADAFVYRSDPQRRVFLADSFFNYLPSAYPVADERITGFYPRTHFQATVLIHELSHLNNATVDIAYLDAGAPYIDLISSPDPLVQAQAQGQLRVTQNRSLGPHTARDKLFKMNRNGVVSDLDNEAADALSMLLALTGTRTLEQARDVFYSDPIKRCDVMLANADTIALLVTKLGRVPFLSAVQ